MNLCRSYNPFDEDSDREDEFKDCGIHGKVNDEDFADFIQRFDDAIGYQRDDHGNCDDFDYVKPGHCYFEIPLGKPNKRLVLIEFVLANCRRSLN